MRRFKALLLTSALGTLALVGCQAGDDFYEGGNEADDGVGNYLNVRLSLRSPQVICDADVDPQGGECDQSVDLSEGASFATTGEVRDSSNPNNIAIVASDYRLITSASKLVSITDFASWLPIPSQIGLKLDFRAVGEPEWRTAGDGIGLDFNKSRFLIDAHVAPSNGFISGEIIQSCGSVSCEGQDYYDYFEDFGEDDLVEYRLVFYPIYNWGYFDEREYGIDFKLEAN